MGSSRLVQVPREFIVHLRLQDVIREWDVFGYEGDGDMSAGWCDDHCCKLFLQVN